MRPITGKPCFSVRSGCGLNVFAPSNFHVELSFQIWEAWPSAGGDGLRRALVLGLRLGVLPKGFDKALARPSDF
jgi:hypothetical protein